MLDRYDFYAILRIEITNGKEIPPKNRSYLYGIDEKSIEGYEPYRRAG